MLGPLSGIFMQSTLSQVSPLFLKRTFLCHQKGNPPFLIFFPHFISIVWFEIILTRMPIIHICIPFSRTAAFRGRWPLSAVDGRFPRWMAAFHGGWPLSAVGDRFPRYGTAFRGGGPLFAAGFHGSRERWDGIGWDFFVEFTTGIFYGRNSLIFHRPPPHDKPPRTGMTPFISFLLQLNYSLALGKGQAR